MPGVPNAAVARQVERAGFEAVYISGAGMANSTAGVPDIGLLTLTEVARLAGYVANAVNIPGIVDADTGFGGAENVARTIRELESAGLAGCHIEDQEFPKRCGHLAGKSIVDVDEMVGKIKAAVAARSGPDFTIIARTLRQKPSERKSCTNVIGNYGAAAGEHDRVRKKSAALVQRVVRFGIPNGDLSDERVPRVDESERRVSPRFEKTRDAIRLDRENANPAGAL